jgi:hypothetical protein
MIPTWLRVSHYFIIPWLKFDCVAIVDWLDKTPAPIDLENLTPVAFQDGVNHDLQLVRTNDLTAIVRQLTVDEGRLPPAPALEGARPIDCVHCACPVNKHGYGQLSVMSRTYPAHQLAYAAHYRRLQIGFDVSHLCGTRACINPSHLVIELRLENNQCQQCLDKSVILCNHSPTCIGHQKLINQ